MMKLGLNIDHVATLRQARGARYPNVVRAALICEEAGAEVPEAARSSRMPSIGSSVTSSAGEPSL